MISKETLAELKRVPILEVAKRYIADRIHRESPGTYKALCPFHPDTNKSLALYTETNTFYCFGCEAGRGGADVISFVMLAENCDFLRAVEIVASIGGIALEQEDSPKMKRLKRLKAQNERFMMALVKAEAAQEYLKSRGVDRAMQLQWELGFVPEDEPYFSAYHGRVSFPIKDRRGNVVGWEFRSVDGSEPKTKVSPNNDIFDKRASLPGIHRLPYKAKRIILVEGFMDMLAFDRVGIHDVCCLIGSKLYNEQIEEIKRMLDPEGVVILALDADEAGRRGTVQASLALEKQGINTKVLKLPDGMDPDEWIKQEDFDSLEEVEEAISRLAAPLIHHQVLRMEANLAAEVSKLKADFNRQLMDIVDRYSRTMQQILKMHEHHPAIGFYREWMYNMINSPLEHLKYMQEQHREKDVSLSLGKTH